MAVVGTFAARHGARREPPVFGVVRPTSDARSKANCSPNALCATTALAFLGFGTIAPCTSGDTVKAGNYHFQSVVAVLLVSLAACGGGSSSSTTPQPTPRTSPPNPPATPLPNQPPSVDAGADRTAVENGNVELTGTASDPDGFIEAFRWVQVSGPVVSIVRSDRPNAGFNAPAYYLGDELVFRLTARDDDGTEISDDVTIRIEPNFGQLPIAHGTAYFARSFMEVPAEYFRLDIDPAIRSRLVLRSFIENDDLQVFASRTLSQSSLLAESASHDLDNDVVYFEPGSPSPVYVRILGGYGDQYTLTLRPHSQYIEAGFPVDLEATSGTFQDGEESRAVTVGNIDTDAELEIVVSAVAQGPTYAINHDGTLVPGWPVSVDYFTTYPSLGNFSGSAQTQEIALGLGPTLGSCVPDRYLLDGSGSVLAGWPITACHAGTVIPPTLHDIDGDGIDEVFFNDRTGFYANGQAIPGWGISNTSSGQPAIADVSGDGRKDFVYSTYTPQNGIEAYGVDGQLLPGFPIVDDLQYSVLRGGPVGLPDFDGDGVHEIVRVRNSNTQFVRAPVRFDVIRPLLVTGVQGGDEQLEVSERPD